MFLLSATIIGLQNQITASYNAANRLKLQVNLIKTKVMVFRKGGCLSARERWFYGTERLEVVNTYRHRGLTSTRLSFRVATDGEHLTRAKRGTMEILKTEEVDPFFHLDSFFFTIFDAKIAPSLLYGSELWGFEQ